MTKKHRRQEKHESSEDAESTDEYESSRESEETSDSDSDSGSGGSSESAEPVQKPTAKKARKPRDKKEKSGGGKEERAGKSDSGARRADKVEAAEPAGDEDTMTFDIIERYRRKITKFIRSDNMYGFAKVLKDTPLAVALHNMHYMFIAASSNDEMVHELVRFNRSFNLVSKKFIRAVREEDSCKHKLGEAEGISEMIQNNTPLKKIKGISDYTPEFIIMATIQSGDLITCNLMIDKWEVSPMFAAAKNLIAAFFGWEDFFEKNHKFKKTEDLVVHAVCGGYRRTLQLVTKRSGAMWLLPETLEKAGLVCAVDPEMKAHFKKLQRKVKHSDSE